MSHDTERETLAAILNEYAEASHVWQDGGFKADPPDVDEYVDRIAALRESAPPTLDDLLREVVNSQTDSGLPHLEAFKRVWREELAKRSAPPTGPERGAERTLIFRSLERWEQVHGRETASDILATAADGFSRQFGAAAAEQSRTVRHMLNQISDTVWGTFVAYCKCGWKSAGRSSRATVFDEWEKHAAATPEGSPVASEEAVDAAVAFVMSDFGEAPVAEPRTPSERETLEEKAAELIRESIMEAYEGFLHHGMFKVRAQRIARQIAALRTQSAPQPGGRMSAPTREQVEAVRLNTHWDSEATDLAFNEAIDRVLRLFDTVPEEEK